MSTNKPDLEEHEHALIYPDCYKTPDELGYIPIETVREIIGEDEKVTRIDRKTDNDVPKESRNALRQDQRAKLDNYIKGVKYVKED